MVGGNEPDLALELFVSVAPFWEYAGRRWEGVDWARKVFGLVEGVESGLAVRAATMAGWLAVSHDAPRVAAEAQQAMEKARRLGDDAGFHRAQVMLAWVTLHSDIATAAGLLSEAITFFERSGDRWWQALALLRRSDLVPNGRSDAARARSLLRALGDMHLYLAATRFLTSVALLEGDIDGAESFSRSKRGSSPGGWPTDTRKPKRFDPWDGSRCAATISSQPRSTIRRPSPS